MKGESALAREQLLKGFLTEKFPSLNGNFGVDHIRKGPANNRILTSVAVVEFTTKHVRDHVLHTANTNNYILFEGSNEIKMKPAKTKRQMHRNWATNAAENCSRQIPLVKIK